MKRTKKQKERSSLWIWNKGTTTAIPLFFSPFLLRCTIQKRNTNYIHKLNSPMRVWTDHSSQVPQAGRKVILFKKTIVNNFLNFFIFSNFNSIFFVFFEKFQLFLPFTIFSYKITHFSFRLISCPFKKSLNFFFSLSWISRIFHRKNFLFSIFLQIKFFQVKKKIFS